MNFIAFINITTTLMGGNGMNIHHSMVIMIHSTDDALSAVFSRHIEITENDGNTIDDRSQAAQRKPQANETGQCAFVFATGNTIRTENCDHRNVLLTFTPHFIHHQIDHTRANDCVDALRIGLTEVILLTCLYSIDWQRLDHLYDNSSRTNSKIGLDVLYLNSPLDDLSVCQIRSPSVSSIKAVDVQCDTCTSPSEATKNVNYVMVAPLPDATNAQEHTYEGNNRKQTHKQSDQTDTDSNDNVSRNSDYCGAGGASGGDKGDDEEKKEISKDDGSNEEEEEEDDDDEEEDEKECQHSESKSSILNADAATFAVETKPLPTIDETKPIQNHKKSTPKLVHSACPGKINISRQLTQEIMPKRVSECESMYNIYDFMNKSLVFNHITNIYKIKNESICVINYGFHDTLTNEILYCVAKKARASKGKYEWIMMDRLWTACDITREYPIATDRLPHTRAADQRFSVQLASIKNDTACVKAHVMHEIINKSKWHNIPIYTKRNYNERKTLSLSVNRFRKKMNQFNVNLNDLRLIPIVRINSKSHYWVEHIWMVRIEENITIGIALQYDSRMKKVRVSGIHLNKDYLCKAHQLIASPHDCHCLDSFQTFYDDLTIGDMDLHKDNLRLKKQITELQDQYDEITELHQQYDTDRAQMTSLCQFIQNVSHSLSEADRHKATSLLQVSTSVVGSSVAALAESDHDEKYSVSDMYRESVIQPAYVRSDPFNGDLVHVPYQQSHPTALQIPTTSLGHSSIPPVYTGFPMAQPIPNVSYGSLSYVNTSALSLAQSSISIGYTPSVPISQLSGASPNPTISREPFAPKNGINSIFIPKSLTERYVSLTNASFKDPKMLYYYLKQTIALQINDGFADLYTDHNDAFRVEAMVCCDLLHKQSGEPLYTIIVPSDASSKFEWKMISLSHFPNTSQLPPSSRNGATFKRQLQQHTFIMKAITKCVHNIKFRNKRQVKRQCRTKCRNGTKQVITMSEKRIKQCVIQSVVHRKMGPIPIIKIKKGKHWIEWVVICEIESKQIHFGVSFKYDPNCKKVDATSIFLDGSEIERQYQLIYPANRCHFDFETFVSGIGQMIIPKPDNA
eukprot:648359_1